MLEQTLGHIKLGGTGNENENTTGGSEALETQPGGGQTSQGERGREEDNPAGGRRLSWVVETGWEKSSEKENLVWWGHVCSQD